jgi:non-canonical (house-cleaning) NTP pyrophosphatase
MDRITGENNIKQKGGAIGFFTKEIMDRKALYISGLIVAFVPFLNEELYFKSK